jgi:translation initiation factor IF-2
MAETSEKTGEKKLSVTPTKTLTLKGRSVEQGVVRQSFSHGRTKAVVVEKVKSRVPGKTKPEVAPAAAPAPSRATSGRAAAPAQTQPAPVAPKPSGVVLRTLTEEERTARARALGDARLREAEERKIAEEEARIQKERDEIERVEREAAEARKADEEKRRKHDAETKRKADEVAKKHFGGETTATPATPALRQPGPRPALEA